MAKYEIRCRYGSRTWDFTLESDERAGVVSDKLTGVLRDMEPPRTEDQAAEMAEAVAAVVGALPIESLGDPDGRFLLKLKTGTISYGALRQALA